MQQALADATRRLQGRWRFVINLTTAKSLGLTMPVSFLLRKHNVTLRNSAPPNIRAA
jgi:hypothetical protein